MNDLDLNRFLTLATVLHAEDPEPDDTATDEDPPPGDGGSGDEPTPSGGGNG